MITQQRIAEELGVSRAAIGHVVNGRLNKVSVEVREQILQCLREHDYQPNALVSALKRKTTKTLGIMVPGIRNSFFPHIIEGVEGEARKRGYQLIISKTGADVDLIREQTQMFRERRVDGIFISAVSRDAGVAELLREIAASKARVMLLNSHYPGVDLPSVDVDDYSIGRMGANHLLELGHKRIAVVTGPIRSEVAQAKERFTGAADAIREAGLPVYEAFAPGGEFNFEGGFEATRALIAKKLGVTAILCPTDMAAMGVYGALREENLLIPSDISVLGCGDIDEGKYLWPSLSTISQQSERIGRTGATMLIDAIESEEKISDSIRLDPQLVIRGSTSRARVDG